MSFFSNAQHSGSMNRGGGRDEQRKASALGVGVCPLKLMASKRYSPSKHRPAPQGLVRGTGGK